MDAATAISIRQISLTADNGSGRQPRQITFHKNKAYVCSFDGTVVRIDTASLVVEAIVECGRNPDGICVANNKLYVSNSGGLDYETNYANTVSVVDIESFSEIKRITVGINPGKIMADSEGDVYVVSRGNYGDVPYVFQRISSHTDEVVQVFDHLNTLNFTICNDTAYLYSYDYSGNSWFKSFDCKTEQVIQESFISDGTVINIPYGINVNPLNGDVYITDACNNMVQGDIYCFDKNGKQKFKITDVGLSPNITVFNF
jgi:DNA-binding beta-propeller fold protein YncE